MADSSSQTFQSEIAQFGEADLLVSPQSPDHSDTPTRIPNRFVPTTEAITSPLPPRPCAVDHTPSRDQMRERNCPSESASPRKCCLISFKGLSPFACRNEDKSILPTHKPRRHSARFETQGTSRPFSLSKIGNFAVTRDDPAGVMTRGEITVSSGEDGGKFATKAAPGQRTRPDLHPMAREKVQNMSACGASQKAVKVIPILRDTSTFDSTTSTNEFDATGTKIEFRNPLDVMDEEQPGRESEDLALGAASSPHGHHHQRKWSDGAPGHRQASTLDMSEQHASFAITEEVRHFGHLADEMTVAMALAKSSPTFFSQIG
ncbi:6067_t:CDS:2, partial [Acaulospora colombiana]